MRAQRSIGRPRHCVVGVALLALAAAGCGSGDTGRVARSPIGGEAPDAAIVSPATTEPVLDEVQAQPTPLGVGTSAVMPPSVVAASPTPAPVTQTPPPATVAATTTPAGTGTAPPATVVAPATVAPSATPTSSTAAATVSGSQAALAANGAEVYTLNCARCHAENGLGTADVGAYGSALAGVGSRYSNDALIAELTTGHPVTFGFADRLSADEIASVVAYLRAAFP